MFATTKYPEASMPNFIPNARLPSESNTSTWSSTRTNAMEASEAMEEEFQVPQVYSTQNSATSFTLDFLDLKTDMMCKWLGQQQLERMWSLGGLEEGVVVKQGRGLYKCWPPGLQTAASGFFYAVQRLNTKCAMTINSRVVRTISKVENLYELPLSDGLRIQIVQDISYLHQCQKHHFAALVQKQGILIVWDDDPNHILERAQTIEDQIIAGLCLEKSISEKPVNLEIHPSGEESDQPQASPQLSGVNEESPLPPIRRVVLLQSILTSFTLVLIISAIGGGWRQVCVEIKVERSWIILAFALVVPLQCWLALFFMQSVVGCLSQLVGPISQIKANTKFFSGERSPRIHRYQLPHVTIQCPVYKEGLWTVIDPTVKSIKAAISTYEMQGGTANIFVNDDGMQLLSTDEARERCDYYDEHSIGWVARPKHNPNAAAGEIAFIRAGKFKKASNMNYALAISNRVEDKLVVAQDGSEKTSDEHMENYRHAFEEVLQEDKGQTWAEGNIRIGDYILLIDSDTRVPVDCFMDAVSEMEQSPEVAIIQFSSGVMNVTDSWFEKGITFFTNLVYTAIQYAVSNGDVAPFVGHNALLRWSAIQDIAYTSDHDESHTERYWSESTVSEDFDMALRLQTSGYILRLATYAGQGFKEGVSLTVYDELARWEKYAYGCSELIFHPFAHWVSRGPFTPLFRRFIRSNMPLPSKITIMAYIGTYYAIGSAWILTLVNYCIVGWFNGHLDHYYIDSFKIYFAIILVFTALGNISLAVLRYRTEERSLFSSLAENFKWIPLLTVFLGGISLHVSQAILSHLFSVDMSWGATSKEAMDTTFFKEIPVIVRKFRLTFIFCFVMTIGMMIMAGVGPLGNLVPYEWQIRFFTAIWPLATIVASHALLPLVLNPGLMQFTF